MKEIVVTIEVDGDENDAEEILTAVTEALDALLSLTRIQVSVRTDVFEPEPATG